MENEKIDRFIETLAEISACLIEFKRWKAELNVKGKISETVERYLDGFNFSPCNGEHSAPMRERNVVLQVNQNRQPWTAKELRNMPFIKDMKYRITKDGLHQFRYRRDGFNVQFTSKNFETARNKAREFIAELKRKLGYESTPKHMNSLDHVAQIWFRTKKAHVENKTMLSYWSVYKNHIKPRFGTRSISNILPMDLQPFFDELHEKLGKTCENCKVLMRGFFDLAVANRICPTNPMNAVIVERHCRKPGKKLTDEQLKRFKSIMSSAGNHGTALLIILYSGIRGAELEKMTFDWNKGTFTVYNAKLKRSQKRREENLTRTVPIFPALWEMRERIEKDDWRMTSHRLGDVILKFWKENSVKDLRHTFTSKARESHVENELVNLWTGHLPGTNVTANVYTHFSEEYQQAEAKKVKPY